MAQLAIKGHSTRGSEVIALLEMLGGKEDVDAYKGDEEDWVYTINERGFIDWECPCNKYAIYSLEEFEEKFPYKVGDKVSVYEYESKVRIDDMKWDGFEIQYSVFTDETEWYSAEELNKCNEPYKEETMEEKETFREDKGTLVEIDLTRELKKSDEIEVILGDYEFVFKNGKTYFVKKKPQYPKTYVECAKILDCFGAAHIDGYKCELLENLQELITCRDAYWKIAGKQMGLNKPWAFKLGNDSKEVVYVISVFGTGIMLDFYHSLNCNKLLVFPTEEMRNAFYENFKGLIEYCKELL